jgi:hypothetical protein
MIKGADVGWKEPPRYFSMAGKLVDDVPSSDHGTGSDHIC